ncbi:MAG: TIGR01777 family protein [Deltaproteobacteria bacterium]|nr:TIGR01777 family protein [Deltaproteobacteria bacterium]
MSAAGPAPATPRTIVVSGASGLIGRALCGALAAAGHRVVRLVRGRDAGPDELRWQPEAGALDLTPLAGDGPLGAVHLAGEGVGDGRWTPARKAAIRGSRVDGTRTLVRALLELGTRPAVLVSSSAVGYYGADRGDTALPEDASPGNDFLAEVCQAWEAETEPARAAGIRVVTMRTGVVLSPDGGALQKLLTPFKLGVGGKVGGGRQWMPWVALSDVVEAYRFALAHGALAGPTNLAAPHPVTQAELARTLARVLGRPAFMPLPGFMVKTLFGEMGASLLLGGQRAVPGRLLAAGFTFRHPDLEAALRHILGRPAR